jgi:alkanesulfonate monooxygenase SsuD/methylene tetrahydromethanopterin reductase-like flavin-dependent oxidoreductase (luciferase family)
MNKNAVLESLKRIVSLYLDKDNEMRNELLKDACEKAVPIIADNEDEAEQYRQVVIEAADDLILSINAAEDLEIELQQAYEKLENDHAWVLDDELAAIVLMQSDNPIAEFFHHGGPDRDNISDPFPFRSCAAAALSEDVKSYIHKEYKIERFTKQNIRAIQKKLSK